MKEKQKIMILGMGGTIAGSADTKENLTGYAPGQLGVETLLQSVPELQNYGPFVCEQFANMDSANMTLELWQALAIRVQEIVNSEEIKGIVITHGTDSMEESAYFLQLAVKTRKPIVLTGAMRPATAISADGPLNLYQAVQVASSEEAIDKGVLVVMNSNIDSARLVQKMDSTHVQTFGSHFFGHLGIVQDGKVYFFQEIVSSHIRRGSLPIEANQVLPKVEILFHYPDMTTTVVDAIAKSGAKGLILSGLGHGTIPTHMREALKQLREQGIFLVRASRASSGMVTPLPTDEELDLIPSYGLAPVKARILLMLALANHHSLAEIRDFFSRY